MSSYIADLNIVDLYQKNLRAPFFTGFLTIGGFLLSLKTFILLKLKDGLYDSEGYKIIFKKNYALDSQLSYYGPLDRLGTALIFSVISALIASGSQLTIGLIENIWAAAFCIAAALTSFALVLFSWAQVTASLRTWFELINEEKLKQLTAEAKEQRGE